MCVQKSKLESTIIFPECKSALNVEFLGDANGMKIYDGADFIGALIKCRSAQHETKANNFTTVDLRKNTCQGYIFWLNIKSSLTSSPGLTKDKNDFCLKEGT